MSKHLFRGLAVGSWAIAALIFWLIPSLTSDRLTQDTMIWLENSPAVQREAEFYRGSPGRFSDL